MFETSYLLFSSVSKFTSGGFRGYFEYVPPLKDNFEVEYSLRNIDKPVGVVEYYLTKKLPAKYKKDLPSPEVLRKKLLERKVKF